MSSLLRKLTMLILVLMMVVTLIPGTGAQWVFADGEDEGGLEVYPHSYYLASEGADIRGPENSGQIMPGMTLAFGADVEDRNWHEGDDYDFRWSVDNETTLDKIGSNKERAKGDNAEPFLATMMQYKSSDFVKEIKNPDSDVTKVTFKTTQEVIDTVFPDDQDRKNEELGNLEEAIRIGFTIRFDVAVTKKGNGKAVQPFEIEINDEYWELCPVNEDALNDVNKGVITVTPKVYKVNNTFGQSPLDGVAFKWVKGYPEEILKKVGKDDTLKAAIEGAYEDANQLAKGTINWNWEDLYGDNGPDEWFVFNYLWQHDGLPDLADDGVNDADVSVSKEGGVYSFARQPGSEKDFHVTLFAYKDDKDYLEWRPYHVDGIDNNVYQCKHNYVDVAGTAVAATCIKAGKKANQECTRCHDVKVGATIPATGRHTPQVIPAKAATCTATGLTEGSKCSVCGTILKAQTTTNALGHNYQKMEGTAKASTCTVRGKKADQKCSRCHEVKKGAAIPKAKHKLTKVKAKKPTYTKTGNIRYWKCKVCGKFFSNAKGTKEIKEKDTIVAKKILEKGKKVVVKGGATVKVINGTKKTVAYVKVPNKTKITIPATVSVCGVKCKIITIEEKAFEKNTAKSIIIGANVKTIKGKAFYKAKTKTVVLQTVKLTKESVKNSMKGSNVKTVKCPPSVADKYKKIFTKKNVGKTVKVVAL